MFLQYENSILYKNFIFVFCAHISFNPENSFLRLPIVFQYNGKSCCMLVRCLQMKVKEDDCNFLLE